MVLCIYTAWIFKSYLSRDSGNILDNDDTRRPLFLLAEQVASQ